MAPAMNLSPADQDAHLHLGCLHRASFKFGLRLDRSHQHAVGPGLHDDHRFAPLDRHAVGDHVDQFAVEIGFARYRSVASSSEKI
jgi:hypothetical protein